MKSTDKRRHYYRNYRPYMYSMHCWSSADAVLSYANRYIEATLPDSGFEVTTNGLSMCVNPLTIVQCTIVV